MVVRLNEEHEILEIPWYSQNHKITGDTLILPLMQHKFEAATTHNCLFPSTQDAFASFLLSHAKWLSLPPPNIPCSTGASLYRPC